MPRKKIEVTAEEAEGAVVVKKPRPEQALYEALVKVKDNLMAVSYGLFPQYFEFPSSELHRKLSDHIINTEESMIVAFPRDYGKSTYVSTFLMAWNVLFSRYHYIAYVATTIEKAELQLRNAVIEIKSHPLLKSFIKKITKDNTKTFEYIDKNNNRIVIKVFGAKVNLRGERYREHRPDIVIVDDVEDASDARSPAYRDEMKRWFIADVLPMTSSGRIFIVGTVVHNDSLLNHLIEQPPTYPTEFKVFKYGIEDENGNPTWESKFPKEKIEIMRSDAAKRGMLDLFYMERMNIATAPENQKFKREYFREYDIVQRNNMVKNGQLNIFMAVDLASSQSLRADYTVIIIVGVNSANHYFILDIRRGRYDSEERAKNIFEMVRKWKPLRIGIERGTILNEMRINVNNEMIRTNTFFIIDELDPYIAKSKQDRIEEALQARYKVGAIWHLKDSAYEEEFEALEEELLMHPKSVHDDIIDALAYIPSIAYAPFDYENESENIKNPSIV